MIFVTVGTQLPFDRLLKAVDAWAGASHAPVFAQVGPSKYKTQHLETTPFLTPTDFERRFDEAAVIVAHAGMGSILSALAHGKPLIVMPRRAALGEHRNDHQIATAKKFEHFPGVQVVWNETELGAALDEQRLRRLDAEKRITAYAPEPFLQRLQQLIDE